MNRKKIIEGHDVSYRYTIYDEEGKPESSRTALDGVDLEVEKGQFIAILGHNGSGKSTLARHLNALLVPDGGTLYVNGYDTRDGNSVWKIRQSAGMVFQNPDNQIIASVVEEDVGFGPENMGVPTEERAAARIARALSRPKAPRETCESRLVSLVRCAPAIREAPGNSESKAYTEAE